MNDADRKATKAAYDRKRREEKREEIAAAKRAYYLANKDKENARVQAWVEANCDRSREIKRAWKGRNPDADRLYAEANAEVIRTRRAEYREARREELAAKQREYAQRPEIKRRIAAYCITYRARRPDVHRGTASWRRKNLRRALAVWADRPAIKAIYATAREQGMHVDHVIPLQGKTVCGLHVESNLQLLTPTENKKKGNRYAG